MESALRGTAKRVMARLLPEFGVARAYRQRVFRRVYERGWWGTEPRTEYFSGRGSVGEPARFYLDAMGPTLADVVKKIGEQTTIVDLGCGDFQVALQLLKRLPPVHYIGCDIVPGLIEENTRNHGSDRVEFRCLDIVSEDLPSGHVYLVRQVFQHLPNRDISRVLARLRPNLHVYVTEGQPEICEEPVNPDKAAGADVRFNLSSGRGRGVELDQPPFSVPVEEICRAPSNLKALREVIVTWRLRFVVDRVSGGATK